MKAPATVVPQLNEDGSVILRFLGERAWRIRDRRRRHRLLGDYGDPTPDLGSLLVVFKRQDPDDPRSAPIGVEEVSLRLSYGVTPTELRRFAWQRWLTVAQAFALAGGDPTHPSWRSDVFADPHTVVGQMTRAVYAEHGIDVSPSTRPGRRGHPNKLYEDIARRYTELRLQGVRSPTKQIAQEMGRSKDTVAGWIRQARALGLLPATRRGVPS